MARILIRELSDETVRQMKLRAERNRRSLEAEVRVILDEAARQEKARELFWQTSAAIQEHTRGRPQTDSAILIREDRDA
jgi:plasmid stability protein